MIKVFKVSNSFIKNQCYLIYQNNVGVLIDPAWEYDLINDFLIENNISLKAVFLTHSHIDHTNLAEEFAISRNIPVYMSREEIDNYGFNCFNLQRIEHLNTIMIANLDIIPIITPGHTFGSVCYLIDNNVFTGDTVFIEGVGICNRIDAHKLYNSIQFLKKHLLDTTLFWPGHSFGEFPGRDLNYLMRHNIYFQFENIKHFVDFRTRENRPNPFLFK